MSNKSLTCYVCTAIMHDSPAKVLQNTSGVLQNSNHRCHVSSSTLLPKLIDTADSAGASVLNMWHLYDQTRVHAEHAVDFDRKDIESFCAESCNHVHPCWPRRVAHLSECSSHFFSSCAMSMLPFLSTPTVTTFMPAMTADAGLVP